MTTIVGSAWGRFARAWNVCRAAVMDVGAVAFVGPDDSATGRTRGRTHAPTAEELSQDTLWRASLNEW